MQITVDNAEQVLDALVSREQAERDGLVRDWDEAYALALWAHKAQCGPRRYAGEAFVAY